MNYLMAFGLFASVAFLWGDPRPSQEPVVGELLAGYPAEAAGIKPGDRIVAIENRPVSLWQELTQQIHGSAEKTLNLALEREGETLTVQVTPRRDPVQGIGLIGISPATIYQPVNFFQALHRGVQQTVGWSLYTLTYLWDKILKRQKPDLAGPLGIATVVAKATRSGAKDFLYLVALISVGIGLFNLFPIPLLDGGHLMFFLWEGLARKPASRKVVQTANVVGLSLLLGILLFATYSDIERLRFSRQARSEAGRSQVAPAPPSSP